MVPIWRSHCGESLRSARLIGRASTFNTRRIEHLYEDPHISGVRLFLHYGDLADSTNLIITGASFHYTDIPFGMFREHQAQKTHDMLLQTQSLVETAANLTKRADTFSEKTKCEILAELDAYHLAFRKAYWRGSGRLARIGLPPRIVNPIRSFRRRLQKLIDNYALSRSFS